MALSWNEIKDRAIHFSKEWENTVREEADAKPFLIAFFNIFGVNQRRVATFEHKVKKINDTDGYIDMLWKGTLLVEMKSRGKNLDKAYQQAKDYILGLNQYEIPKYIMICDFDIFHLYDLDSGEKIEFHLSELIDYIEYFGFIAGYQKKEYKEQDKVNIDAAELMGKLHDRLKEIGYVGHSLEVYLVRLLFILFADDTTIFEKDIFFDFIKQKTSEDGSDLAARLSELFFILNTPKEKRLKNLDEDLNKFPYVNGKLFEEVLPPASFDKKMRDILLECCTLDWGGISPAIFGSMFQSVMNPKERRNLGAHYTSEKNILKLIKPLFLDDLLNEFEIAKGNQRKLKEFHNKLSKLKFLDPACGCGNFLIITYRELRLLEIEILREMRKSDQLTLDISSIMLLDVDMMYGIEYEEFPVRIAEVAMWLIDHQMNMLVSKEFGQYIVRLPLKKSAKIYHNNSLRIDWEDIIEKEELSYILGNPPFIGKKEQNEIQKEDMKNIFIGLKNSGVLDYVTAWYVKASQYIQGSNVKVAFVSTNSITQGEQVGILWEFISNKYNIIINFAHRTFSWKNEAKGNAAVHCVIVGFANYDVSPKYLFEYEDINGEPHEIKVKNINYFLVEGKNATIKSRNTPICDVSEMNYGSMPIDEGNLILSDEEKMSALEKEPFIQEYLRAYTGGDEFINNKKRWCLWLADIEPNVLRKSKFLLDRVEKNRQFRLRSNREATKKLAQNPTLFGEIRQPNNDYIIIPKVSSENRKYIPIGIISPSIIASGSCLIVPKANLYTFGILTSIMHMTWMKITCGRMKSDYQYSASIVYNNFPWPENPSEKQMRTIEEKAQKVLDIRKEYEGSTLADLYDILSMPSKLVKAHNELDKAVDLAYRSQVFISETKRLEFLFDLYENYTAGLFKQDKKKRK